MSSDTAATTAVQCVPHTVCSSELDRNPDANWWKQVLLLKGAHALKQSAAKHFGTCGGSYIAWTVTLPSSSLLPYKIPPRLMENARADCTYDWNMLAACLSKDTDAQCGSSCLCKPKLRISSLGYRNVICLMNFPLHVNLIKATPCLFLHWGDYLASHYSITWIADAAL